MTTLLITSFGRWGRESYNSSDDILRPPPAVPAGWQLRHARLPVSWRHAVSQFDALLATAPDAVICFGMCGGGSVRCEQRAVNEADSALLDADGLPPAQPILVPDGPPDYASRLPLAEIASALAAAAVPSLLSSNAGQFLCNAIFFHLMHRLAFLPNAIPGGFIHVPHFDGDGGLPRETLRRAAQTVIDTTLRALAGR